MKHKFILFLSLILITFCSCKSINSDSTIDSENLESTNETIGNETTINSKETDFVSETSIIQEENSSNSYYTESSSQTNSYYKVNIPTIENVTITLDREDGLYKAGEDVSLEFVFTDKENIRFNTISAVETELVFYKNTIKSESIDGYAYTFIMPNMNITINLDVSKKHKVKDIIFRDEFMFQEVDFLSDNKEYFEGDPFTIQLTTNYYDLVNYLDYYKGDATKYVCYMNEQRLNVTLSYDNANAIPLINTIEISGYFPDSDVTFYFFYAKNTIVDFSSGYTVNLDNSNDNIEFYGIDSNNKYSSLTFAVKRTPGYVIESIEYLPDSSLKSSNWESINLVNDFQNDFGLYSIDFTSLVISNSVSIRIVGREGKPYNLTLSNNSAMTFNKTISSSASEGDYISFKYDVANEDEFFDSNPVISGASFSYLGNNEIIFTMPSNDVSITFSIKAKGNIIITNSTYVDSYLIILASGNYAVNNKAMPNQAFRIYFYLKDEYKDNYKITSYIEKYYSNSTLVSNILTENYFIMPEEGDVEITPVIEQYYTVSLADNCEHVKELEFGYDKDDGKFIRGEEVYFTFDYDNGYKIKSVYIENSSLTITKLAKSNLDTSKKNDYYFIMPANDVKIVIEFEEISYVSVNLIVEENSSIAYINMAETETYYSVFSLTKTIESLPIGYQIQYPCVVTKDNTKTISLELVYNDLSTYDVPLVNLSADLNSAYFLFSNFDISANLSSIKIIETSKDELTYTITKDENVDVSVTSYKSGNKIYSYDYISISINTEASEGKIYKATVKNSKGEVISKNDDGYYQVKDNFSIIIDEDDAINIDITIDSDIFDTFNSNVAIYHDITEIENKETINFKVALYDKIIFKVNSSSTTFLNIKISYTYSSSAKILNKGPYTKTLSGINVAIQVLGDMSIQIS